MGPDPSSNKHLPKSSHFLQSADDPASPPASSACGSLRLLVCKKAKGQKADCLKGKSENADDQFLSLRV